jgi:hypothetical protein
MNRDEIAKRAINETVKANLEHYKQKGQERTESQVRREVEAIANKVYREKGAKLYK